MMSNSDMIIASIGDSPYVLGIALNSIIGRKIISGGNKSNNSSNNDTLYLPNGLIQTPDDILDIPIGSNSNVTHIEMPCNDIPDDLYEKLLTLSNSYQGEPDTNNTHVKSQPVQTLGKSTSTTGKNKKSKQDKNKKDKNSTRKK